jgi:hypothetical protein
MRRRLAPIDIEHSKTLSQLRADQCLTRQRHELFGSMGHGNDAALNWAIPVERGVQSKVNAIPG